MNYFMSFKLNIDNGFIIIEAILPVENNGTVIEVIPVYEFHYDDLSEGDKELFPKVGERVFESRKRIESYIQSHQYWRSRWFKIEIKENLRGLETYVNSLVHSSRIDTTI